MMVSRLGAAVFLAPGKDGNLKLLKNCRARGVMGVKIGIINENSRGAKIAASHISVIYRSGADIR